MSTPTEVCPDSKFASGIKDYFIKNRPKRIIETGLYHGTGSTSVIASLIRDIPLDDAMFFSIECNIENIHVAHDNLSKISLSNYVSVLTGLSIPRSLLPTEEQINKTIELASSIPGIKMDHEQDPRNAPKYYTKETEKFAYEDIIGWILNNWDYKIDFALLDSGGHMGKIEFDYLISQLKSSCGIALDDTRHIKHFQSRDAILKDKRFEIINDEEEKFGFMIVRFNP